MMGRIKRVARTVVDMVDEVVISVKDKFSPSHLKVDPNAHPEGTKERYYAKDIIKSRHSIIILSMNEEGEVFVAIQTSKEPKQLVLKSSALQTKDMKYDIFGLFKLDFLLNTIPNDNNPRGNLSYEVRREKLQAIKDFAAANEKPIKIFYHDVELYQLSSISEDEIDALVNNYMKEKQLDESNFDVVDYATDDGFYKKCLYVERKMSDIVDDELSEKMLDCSPCRVEILTKLSESKLPDVVFEAMHEELLDNNLENTKFKWDGDYLEKQDNLAENFVKDTSLIDEFGSIDMLIGDKE